MCGVRRWNTCKSEFSIQFWPEKKIQKHYHLLPKKIASPSLELNLYTIFQQIYYPQISLPHVVVIFPKKNYINKQNYPYNSTSIKLKSSCFKFSFLRMFRLNFYYKFQSTFIETFLWSLFVLKKFLKNSIIIM